MRRPHMRAVLGALVFCALVTSVAAASPPSLTDFTNVPSANAKSPGVAPATILSPELNQSPVAWGSLPLENPSSAVGYYGYGNDGPFVPSTPASNVEATKTEPDKNTYLVFKGGLSGPQSGGDYGTHFLFQGHENGPSAHGYITRINLDAGLAHRVTLLGDTDSTPALLPAFDGSTWDPWAGRLLFTSENGSSGGVWQATPSYPSTIDNLQAFIGRGGFEAIQNDSAGNVYIVEDAGGTKGTGANADARRPNSYVYRFLPNDPADLREGGKIEALQVWTTGPSAHAITWGVGLTADQVINAPDFVSLHQYGKTFPTKWIMIAQTTASSVLPGPDDNALARAAGATPFKRPENGQFRPGSKFTEFYFDETGDTNASSSANGVSGGWGSIMKLVQSPASDDGTLALFYSSDQAHSSFDNVAFFSEDEVAFVEDAGDTLHTQRNALDSAYLFDVTVDYSNPANQPIRFIAQGRDPSATIDSSLLGTAGFQNDGDNELTGIHVSDGDPGRHGILGDKIPKPFQPDGQWRVFYTQQHGDNITYELTHN